MRVFLAVILLVWTGMHVYVFWRAVPAPGDLACACGNQGRSFGSLYGLSNAGRTGRVCS